MPCPSCLHGRREREREREAVAILAQAASGSREVTSQPAPSLFLSPPWRSLSHNPGATSYSLHPLGLSSRLLYYEPGNFAPTLLLAPTGELVVQGACTVTAAVLHLRDFDSNANDAFGEPTRGLPRSHDPEHHPPRTWTPSTASS